MDEKAKYKYLYQKLLRIKSNFNDIDEYYDILVNQLNEKIKINHNAIYINEIKDEKNKINNSKNQLLNNIIPDVRDRMEH